MEPQQDWSRSDYERFREKNPVQLTDARDVKVNDHVIVDTYDAATRERTFSQQVVASVYEGIQSGRMYFTFESGMYMDDVGKLEPVEVIVDESDSDDEGNEPVEQWEVTEPRDLP